jgi:hypothetical protein
VADPVTAMTGLQYPLLAEVHGVEWRLFVLCAISAVGDTVYWTSYHAYFALLGDAEHRGHQLGAREAIAALVGIVGPLAIGWALTRRILASPTKPRRGCGDHERLHISPHRRAGTRINGRITKRPARIAAREASTAGAGTPPASGCRNAD